MPEMNAYKKKWRQKWTEDKNKNRVPKKKKDCKIEREKKIVLDFLL